MQFIRLANQIGYRLNFFYSKHSKKIMLTRKRLVTLTD